MLLIYNIEFTQPPLIHLFSGDPAHFPLPLRTSYKYVSLAIERITSVDRTTEIAVYDTNDIAESIDATWIVSGQSPLQKDMIRYANITEEEVRLLQGGPSGQTAGFGSNGVIVTKFLQLLMNLELYLELSYFFSQICIVVAVTEVTKVP